MKKLFSFFIVFVFLIAAFTIEKANATLNPGFTRDSLTGLSYDTLTTGTKVTTVQSGSVDDGNIYVTLPFTFSYNGGNYTRITVCTNGWVAFDSITSASFTSANLFTSTAPNTVVGCYFRDANLNTANDGMFKHGQRIIGSDTVYVVEYRNFSGASSGGTSSTQKVNFQIWLYKTSNKIEIRYGAILGTIVTGASIGVEDDETGAAPHYLNALTNNSTQTTTVSVWPGNGNGYRFNPLQVLANDVGCTAILSPVGGFAGIQTPQATIKNFGTNNQLTPFNVTCTISPGGYSNTVTDTVSAGLSNNVSFANVNFTTPGTYTVTVYTSLAGDQQHANDTQRVSINIIDPNYGSSGGYFFANNLATTQPSYPRWGWKDTTGSKSLVINGAPTGLATLVGNIDDGYFILSLKNILLSLGQDTTNRHIKYNGVCYDSIFPGTNGIVPLTQASGATSINTFTMDAVNIANNCFLPFYHDFDLGTLTFNTTNRLSYKAKGDQLIITYSKVAAFAPEQEWASFQLVVELVTGCASANSNFRYTYADTTNRMSSDSLVNDFLNAYNTTPPAATNFRNYTIGYTYTGAVNAYAQYCTSLNTFGGPNNGFVKRSIFNTTTKKGLTVEFGPNQNKLDLHNTHMLTISLALEGLQNCPNGPRVRDTVQVILRDGSVAPYKVMEKQFVYLDSVYSTFAYGRKTIEMSMLKKSSNYYLQVKHRNSIATWTNLDSTQQLDTINYNFTSGVCQAFGCNQALVAVDNNGVAVPSFYTGDPTQDGIVDASDIVAIYNDLQIAAEGPYLLTDLNWDEITDSQDLILCYNNNINVVGEVAPPGANRPVMENIIPVELRAPVFNIPDNGAMEKQQYLNKLSSQVK